jgi:hypothetical protein
MSISEYFKLNELFDIHYLNNDILVTEKLNDILIHPIIKNNIKLHSLFVLIPFIDEGKLHIGLYKKYLYIDNKRISSIFLSGIAIFLIEDEELESIYNWNNYDSIDLNSENYIKSYFNLFSDKTYNDYIKDITFINSNNDNSFINYKLTSNISKNDMLNYNRYYKISKYDITFTLELLKLINENYNFSHTNLKEYHSSLFYPQNYKSNVFFNNLRKFYQYDKIAYEFYKSNFNSFKCRCCDRNFTENFTFYLNLFYGTICVNCYLDKKKQEKQKKYKIKSKILNIAKKSINLQLIKNVDCNSTKLNKNFYKDFSKNLINEINSINSNKCPICYDNLTHTCNIYVTSCGHCFHKKCLEEYKEYNISNTFISYLGDVISCPICKQNATYSKLHLFNKN